MLVRRESTALFVGDGDGGGVKSEQGFRGRREQRGGRVEPGFRSKKKCLGWLMAYLSLSININICQRCIYRVYKNNL